MVAPLASPPFPPPSYAPARFKCCPDTLKLYLLHTDVQMYLFLFLSVKTDKKAVIHSPKINSPTSVIFKFLEITHSGPYIMSDAACLWILM